MTTTTTPTRGRRRGYAHMGAVLCDAGLQAGLNYQAVVAPRIERLVHHWPTSTTTRAFQRKARRYGLVDVLRWRDPLKLARIDAMAELFASHDVDTCQDARRWLRTATAEMRLLDIHGVGLKTVDYLRILVGISELAVDRHIRAFANSAGVTGNDLAIKGQLVRAASRCGLALDHADELLWRRATGVLESQDATQLDELRHELAAASAPIMTAGDPAPAVRFGLAGAEAEARAPQT